MIKGLNVYHWLIKFPPTEMIHELEKLQKEGNLQELSDYIISHIDDIPKQENSKDILDNILNLFKTNSELVSLIAFDSFSKFLELSYIKELSSTSKAILTLFSHKASSKEGNLKI